MHEYKEEDLIGRKFGRLTILSVFQKISSRGYKVTCTHCKCDCGVEKDVEMYSLLKGLTGSCGCKGKESRLKSNTIHNLSKHPLYRTFFQMKQRCYNKKNPKYDIYGGRGIIICEEWLNNPIKFIEWSLNNGWDKNLSIDRIDVNGDYSPENCRWTNDHIQASNKTLYKNNSSNYVGIRQDIRYKSSWIARITINNKKHHIGTFKTKKDALDARNNYIIRHNLTEYKIQEWKGE